MSDLYTVWVGGVEVNDTLLNKTDAEALADQYRADGYPDVQVEQIEGHKNLLTVFRQPSNPTVILTLQKYNEAWRVEQSVYQHKFLDGKTLVMVDQVYDYYDDALNCYNKLRSHLVWLAEEVGNEVDMDTGEELPND